MAGLQATMRASSAFASRGSPCCCKLEGEYQFRSGESLHDHWHLLGKPQARPSHFTLCSAVETIVHSLWQLQGGPVCPMQVPELGLPSFCMSEDTKGLPLPFRGSHVHDPPSRRFALPVNDHKQLLTRSHLMSTISVLREETSNRIFIANPVSK